MPSVRQTSFAAGELSPLLWGRSDLDLYSKGARSLSNFFVSKQGAAVSRPGTTFVTAAGVAAGRLFPFVYSDVQSYVLLFTNGLVSFITEGAVLVADGSMWGDGSTPAVGTAYYVVSPYTYADLQELRIVQSGDVITITHPAYPPRELRRNSTYDWEFTALAFDRPAPSLSDVLVQGAPPAGDSTHPPREWSYWVTELRRDSQGFVYESAPLEVTDSTVGALPDRFAVYSDMSVELGLTSTITPSSDPDFVAYRVYRGRGGLHGWIGDTDTSTFTDAGQDPDYTIQPPQGRNPFKVYDSSGVLLRTEDPRAVTYFEERLVFGGTSERPDFLFLSATGDYYNFDERLLAIDTQALLYELASRRAQSVMHLLGLGRLLVFTNSSVWSFGGAGGNPLSPATLPQAREEVPIGTTIVPPLALEGAALFVRAKGGGAGALVFDDNRGGFQLLDVKTHAAHLFSPLGLTVAPATFRDDTTLGRTTGPAEIISWAYAEDPWGLVWAVRRDGTLLSLTFDVEAGMAAWAQHSIDGYVLDVCAVPEDDEDGVYLLTMRAVHGSTGYFSVERMASRVARGGTDDDICVDYAHEYSGAVAQVLTGLTAFADRDDVWVIGKDNPPRGPFTVTTAGELDLGEEPTANNGANVVLYVGLLYQPELETLDAAPQARNQKTVTKVYFEVDQSRGLWAGQDLEHLKEWKQRLIASGYGVPSAATEVVEISVAGKWDKSARAVLRQTLPLPVTVVGLTREVDGGG